MISFSSIEEAIRDFREGKFVIVVDDEDRENEGDFITAAEMITPEKVNFMLREGRGVLCAPITKSRAAELELPHQVLDNTSMLGTPFTITVDKLEGCTTGVSAADRAATIRHLANPDAKPADFGRPGHINPLYARSGGVLQRAGHTEAGVDLARLAGLRPAAALIEMNVAPKLLQERLGHERIQTTLDTYGHLYPNKQAEVAKQLDDFMSKS